MQVGRKLRTIFIGNETSCESTERRLMRKFETTSSVLKVKLSGRKRSRQTEEQVVLEQDSIIASPGKLIRRRLQQLNIPISSVKCRDAPSGEVSETVLHSRRPSSYKVVLCSLCLRMTVAVD